MITESSPEGRDSILTESSLEGRDSILTESSLERRDSIKYYEEQARSMGLELVKRRMLRGRKSDTRVVDWWSKGRELSAEMGESNTSIRAESE